MNMKRFLILSILIVFVTVSCAGPNKVGKLKTLEKEWKECADSIDKNLNPEAFDKTFVEECLEKEGYEFKKAEEPPSGNKVTAKDIGLIALVIVLSPLIIAYGVLLIGSAP